MSTHKHIDLICVAVTILAVLLTVLYMNGEALGIAHAVGGDSGDGMFTANDLNADWDTSSATRIVLSDSGGTVSGNGVYTDNGDIYIAYPGHYVLTGELTDGSVIVAAGKSDKIWLLLDGVSIHCGNNAALRVEQADKVFLTLAEGTENSISSGAQYSEDAVSAGVDGAIYSRDDLTINGSGALEVSAAYKHGIVCNDDLAITGGNITISAAQDGIHANDSVRLRDASLNISAGDDGITASNNDETSFIYIASGSIYIPACYEGIEAISVTVAGGTIGIVPEDDGINANGSGTNSVICVTGGDIAVVNPSGRDADGFDSNGSIYIEGGNILISVSDSGGNYALDYGKENGGECVISGGTIIACGGSAMAEGFDASSPQGFLMLDTSAATGASVTLEDASGRELLSAEIPCSFSSMVLSAPGMQVGDVCTLTVNGVAEQITVDNTTTSGGFAMAGMFRGGMRGDRSRMAGGQGNFPSFDGQEGPPAFGGQEGGRFGGAMQQPPDQGDGTIQPPGRDGEAPPDWQDAGENDSGGPFDRRNMGGRGGFGDEAPGGTAAAPIDGSGVVLLAVSVAVLLAGLAVAFKFKR